MQIQYRPNIIGYSIVGKLGYSQIKRNYPGWREEQVYDEVDRLADIYENERFNHISSKLRL
jgi:hypothetical protein